MKSWVIGTLEPLHGMIDVKIDGKAVGTAGTYHSYRKMKLTLFTTGDLENKEHKLEILVSAGQSADKAI